MLAGFVRGASAVVGLAVLTITAGYLLSGGGDWNDAAFGAALIAAPYGLEIFEGPSARRASETSYEAAGGRTVAVDRKRADGFTVRVTAGQDDSATSESRSRDIAGSLRQA